MQKFLCKKNPSSNRIQLFTKWMCVCRCCTSPPRVNSGVVLIVDVWMIQVAKGFKLKLSVLEKVQLGEKSQPHKPNLEQTQKYCLWKVQIFHQKLHIWKQSKKSRTHKLSCHAPFSLYFFAFKNAPQVKIEKMDYTVLYMLCGANLHLQGTGCSRTVLCKFSWAFDSTQQYAVGQKPRHMLYPELIELGMDRLPVRQHHRRIWKLGAPTETVSYH